MANNCTLRIFSECIGSSSIPATQNIVLNGRPDYVFSFTTSQNDLISGRIYWDSVDLRWYVEDTDNQVIISYLPFDRPHPYGTNLEWQSNSLLTYGCLSTDSSFSTQWIGNCPPSNFVFCCTGDTESENYFGIQNFENFGYYGVTFYLENPQFSGCATLIESVLPQDSIIYSSVDSYTFYEDCSSCTGGTLPCYNQPVYETPTPTPVLTADTGCGINYVLVNECQVITVFPLSVTCNVTNVTTIGGSDGSIELMISGGTPPYTIGWVNGFSTSVVTNLVAGTYSYTVTDYYGDFIIKNSCIVSQPNIVTPIRNTSNFCLAVNINGIVERYTYLYEGLDDNGYPYFIREDNLGVVSWQPQFNPPYWILTSELTQGYLINYNEESPPLSGWTWTQTPGFGFAQGTDQNCQQNGNFCITIDVSSFSEEPFRIYFNEFSVSNSKPTWVDNSGQFEVSWVENSPNSAWVLQGLPENVGFTITNSNPQIPPTNQWFVNGDLGTVVLKYNTCFESIICATFTNLCEPESIEMNSGNIINGQQSWIGTLPCGNIGTWLIYYSDTEESWVTSGLTIDGINTNSTNIGPIGYFDNGGFFDLYVYDGRCNTQGSLRMSVTFNEQVAENTGGIVIEIEGGQSPYFYSIDGGTTYQKFPIFSNLKSGNYESATKDNLGAVIKQTIQIGPTPRKTTYKVELNTTSRRTVNTVTTSTIEYTTTLNITPTLPSGVYIGFNLIHNDIHKVSPVETASNWDFGDLLLKNNTEVPIDEIDVDTYSFTNNLLSCQDKLIYVTATTNSWYDLTMSSSDELVITTTVTNIKNGKYSCYISENIETYSLSNVKILGCDNCEVVNQNSTPVLTPTSNPTPVLTPTVSTPAVTSPAGPTICFDYTFSSVSYKDTKTPSGSYSGYFYYNLTHGVVWSSGGVYWYWSDVLGNNTTFYDRLYNGVQSTPNSLSYSWQNPFGSTGLMNTSLIGACS